MAMGIVGIKLDEGVPAPCMWFDSAFGAIRGGAAIAPYAGYLADLFQQAGVTGLP